MKSEVYDRMMKELEAAKKRGMLTQEQCDQFIQEAMKNDKPNQKSNFRSKRR